MGDRLVVKWVFQITGTNTELYYVETEERFLPYLVSMLEENPVVQEYIGTNLRTFYCLSCEDLPGQVLHKLVVPPKQPLEELGLQRTY